MSTSNDTIHTTHTTPSTGTSVYWVTRVVEQMQGCSPSRIDSVIQANLPPVKIRWSQRPDTLEIPGLKGRKAYSTDILTQCYEPTYFKEKAGFHTETPLRQPWKEVEPMEYRLSSDNIINCCILSCFIALSLLIHNTRGFLKVVSHEFFQKPNYGDRRADANKEAGIGNMLLANVLLASILGILFYCYSIGRFNPFTPHFPQHLMLVAYAAIAFGVMLAQRLVSAFINWIFFDKTYRQEWRIAYNFHIITEAIILFPTLATAIYRELTHTQTLVLCLAMLFVLKTTLLYKAYTTFSFKIYGILHLLSYLCALEIIPLLAMWVILTRTAQGLL